MRVRMEPTSGVKPHPWNPRRAHDVQGIANSMRAFGVRQPLVVYDGDGFLLVGHGRLLAAHQLGLDKVPVHHVAANELTQEQAVAYRLADNRSAEGSEWDEALLLSELALLDDRARQEAGFEDAYIAELKRRQDLENLVVDPSQDQVPEPPAQPVSRRGDLWLPAITSCCVGTRLVPRTWHGSVIMGT